MMMSRLGSRRGTRRPDRRRRTGPEAPTGGLARDTIGEAECGEPVQVTASGNLVALVSRSCTAYAGQLGFTTHELYEGQSDGSLRYKFDMFGMR
jgi:hypothetical protein